MKSVSLNKVNSILLFSILLIIVLYYGRKILTVLFFSMLLAMVMTPVSEKLEQVKLGRIVSSIICLLIVLLVFTAIIWIITIQAINIGQEIPSIQEKFEKYLEDLQVYIQTTFNISPERQITIVKEQTRSLIQSAGSSIKTFVMGFTSLLGSLILTLVFMFLFLLQRERYKIFILKLYKGDKVDETKQIIEKISKVGQQYLWGRLISIVILTILYYIGLLIIGIKNALLLSAIASLLTFIPYIGPVIGGLFPFLMAIVTEDSIQPALAVAFVIFLIQTIDNYFIEPYIVGGEVNINAFFTILILIVGGVLWGIAGVILFLPMLGMAKIIFDHVEPLQPYGFLIGNQKPAHGTNNIWKKIKSFFSKEK